MSRLSICAALATCLLTTPVTLALAADPTPTVTADVMQTTRILLQNVAPDDVLKEAHWDRTETLPPGVSQIATQAVNNALLVIATPAGLAKVRALVAILDIEPRQVQIKSVLATATDAQLETSKIDFALSPVVETQSATDYTSEFIEYATGKSVAALLKSLTKSGGILQQPVLTTTNNVTAQISLSTKLPDGKSGESRFQVTPRVNSDDSVTLVLDVSVSQDAGSEKRDSLKLNTIRTVKNGETTVMGKKTASGKTLLLFVTPTVTPVK